MRAAPELNSLPTDRQVSGNHPRPPVFLAAVGDTNSIVTWSGIPFHLLQAGRIAGMIDEGLPLDTLGGSWQRHRLFWNALRPLRLEQPGGYQYSPAFLERLWAPVRSRLLGSLVINCFQLYPPSLVQNDSIEKWFFIDQTLIQLFDYYGIRATVGKAIARDAVVREREGYAQATGILTHSRWAARSVIEDYGIDPNKVHVVVPGANLNPDKYANWESRKIQVRVKSSDSADTLRLVFVGKHPQRKGLDRLLRALRLARRQSGRCTLKIIGCSPEDLPPDLRAVEGVIWSGFIDKRHEPARYLDEVAACDMGCLLSRAEAGGIGLREYHALGLAVLGPDTGGSPDHALPEASILVPPDAPDEVIAGHLLELEQDHVRLAAMKATSWRRRHEVLWSATVQRIGELVGRCEGSDKEYARITS